jgi:hypothetical protein
VHFDVASQSELALRQVFGARQLDQLLAQRCQAFLDWAQQEAGHRAARDATLRALAFPAASFRPGQRCLAEAVYRAAARGRCLLAQAPTGIGKTIGTVLPLLRAMPAHGIDKVAFLNCKGTGRLKALEALADLRSGTAGQSLRVLTTAPKDAGRPLDGRRCWKLIVPPIDVKGFWSLSMYDKTPDGQLFFAASPIGRHSVGDRRPGVQRRAGGSIELLLQHDAPTDTANWLPTPAGPMALKLRTYLPSEALRRGEAPLSRLVPVE